MIRRGLQECSINRGGHQVSLAKEEKKQGRVNSGRRGSGGALGAEGLDIEGERSWACGQSRSHGPGQGLWVYPGETGGRAETGGWGRGRGRGGARGPEVLGAGRSWGQAGQPTDSFRDRDASSPEVAGGSAA